MRCCLGCYSLLFVYHLFPFFILFIFFSVMLYFSYTHARFHLVHCIFAIVMVCSYFVRFLMAFVYQEIKRIGS